MGKPCVGFTVFVGVVLISLLFQSCISNKQLSYFNNLPDSSNIQLQKLVSPQINVQPNDILDIRIGGASEKTIQYLSQYVGGASGATLTTTVDAQGEIELPLVGKLKVEGLSKDQVRDTIKKSYEPYVKDPIVLVKFGNFKFYALGEFNRPGNISVEGERVNVLEAMALAGDMTQFAIRDNVKIIRDSNGHREVISLNFSDQSILNSPYYYLKRNDIIYARARGIKAVSSNFQRNAALIGSVTSLLAIILVFIRN